ncbi:cobyric acid synthase [Paenibacillus macquariensis]|uniref:Cobyric acid synthase n=1 Tax=Paenibacillus macquariensis TaxID=948756 RepID=A0ABY1JRQ2_9BACL|nr:cobyric acid synthase [Paenibacillus macquariensis]MEC0092804.1 cobyric acid synthase [Paenibacillus macquariensis]OAB36187.1 cobyric acid synthase CobQ [Paenibacillus macquariensis subsp. macquariensis]SIQ66530.1 adenosylcobyric acid synthase (glutamine-hydrolysing) [Paenibacillus macquariensis]
MEKSKSHVSKKDFIGAVLMLQGTASDVGKSIVTTALCRIFTQDGYGTAPYKSQNMALNSYVTEDGKEIGRAQGVQAEACGIKATTDMNPILIKPVKDMFSQIVVHGEPYQQMSASDYREHFLPRAKDTVMDALNRLRDQYDIVVMEGAGSPAEINLKNNDIVNMNLAGWADAPVLLIADIDRGGVFAFIVGTLELLESHERQRVKGFIINKFRGDIKLLEPGLTWLTERTGIPVLGVLPFIEELKIEAEDSVVLDTLRHKVANHRDIDIAVIQYPRISNFTDFDPLREEKDVSVRYVKSASELGSPDVIILPGTKDTIGDLEYLRMQGLDDGIAGAIESETQQLVGICGGYQMLGEMLIDPFSVEASESRSAEGLAYLPVTTTFLKEKTTVRVHGTLALGHSLRLEAKQEVTSIEGYEIHMGETDCSNKNNVTPLFQIERITGEHVHEGWGTLDGATWGTYLHGVFHNDTLRRSWLDGIRVKKGLKPFRQTYSSNMLKEQEFDRIAEVVRNHVDMEQIYAIMGIK